MGKQAGYQEAVLPDMIRGMLVLPDMIRGSPFVLHCSAADTDPTERKPVDAAERTGVADVRKDSAL